MKKNNLLAVIALCFITFSTACKNSSKTREDGAKATESVSGMDSNNKTDSLNQKVNATALSASPTANKNDCKCYANGTSFDPGGAACLGGWLAVCINRNGNCGWDYPEYEGKKQPCQ